MKVTKKLDYEAHVPMCIVPLVSYACVGSSSGLIIFCALALELYAWASLASSQESSVPSLYAIIVSLSAIIVAMRPFTLVMRLPRLVDERQIKIVLKADLIVEKSRKF